MGSRLRYHRKKAGLSQNELAQIVGSVGHRQVAKHENFRSSPSIIAAIGYEVALKVSIAELFPGLYETIEQGIERRLSEMERRLEQSVPKGRRRDEAAQQLVWMRERRRESGSPTTE
jgi:transcriptional regulator with XRE-family HTH domain